MPEFPLRAFDTEKLERFSLSTILLRVTDLFIIKIVLKDHEPAHSIKNYCIEKLTINTNSFTLLMTIIYYLLS